MMKKDDFKFKKYLTKKLYTTIILKILKKNQKWKNKKNFIILLKNGPWNNKKYHKEIHFRF